jgi:endoglucanase
MAEWARRNGKKAFLGEFGVSQDKTCLAGLKGALDALQDNSDVWLGWTYWVGGDWWPESEALNVQPHDGRERKQMPMLETAAKAAGPDKAACRTTRP